MTTVEVALVSRNSDQRLSPTVTVTALPVLPISRVLSVEKGVHHTSVTASRHTPVLPRPTGLTSSSIPDQVHALPRTLIS